MDRFLIRNIKPNSESVRRQEEGSATATASTSKPSVQSTCNRSSGKQPRLEGNYHKESTVFIEADSTLTALPAAFPRWKKEHPWLDHNEKNWAICTNCTEACNKNLVLNLDSHELKSKETWVQTGFSYWKHAADRLRKHSTSTLHFKCTESLNNQKSVNVVQQLSTATLKQMMDNRTALKTIFSTLKLLGRQGLAIRGAANDEDSNFMTILRARAEDVSQLESWLKRTQDKWLHHTIQNEILEIMANKIINDNLEEIRKAEFYSILLDETADVSRMEQISIYFRIASPDLLSTEYFMGFYSTKETTAETLFKIVKDVLVRFQLPLAKLRGQCYDGAANVSGRISGLQQRIQEEEDRAIFIHCNAHNLNLAVQDGIENVLEARKFIGVMKELINFVRDSPKRIAQFQELQASAEKENENDLPALAAYCPTRWVLRIKSLKTVAANYKTLMKFFQTLIENRDVDSTIVAKASGFLHSMESFKILFLLVTMIEIFDRIEILNKDLQHSELCVVDSYKKIEIVAEIMNSSRDSKFTKIWRNCNEMAKNFEIEEADLPRKRKLPKRFQNSNSDGHVFESPEDYYKKIYCEIFDQVYSSLNNRFDTDSARFFKSLESFAVGQSNDVKKIVSFYRGDFKDPELINDRDFFLEILQREKKKVSNIREIVNFLRENKCYMDLIPEFVRFIRLIITIPGSTCSNERSFSVLRRIKNYLRSSTAQNRLNHVAILHSYSEAVDKLNLDDLMNEFISRNSKRTAVFAMS